MATRDDRLQTLEADYTVGSISDKISSLVLTGRMPRSWLLVTAAAFSLLMLFLLAVGYLLVTGVGIWGINIPVGWGFAIINFVWWIGIGHAGTLISAILLLLRQQWRTSINRFAEAMTLFAVACAGLFPLMHLGRPTLFYWLLPYPNTMGLMPQFRSPLVWDVIAVITYATVSLMFWYIGLIPDLATLRDRATNRVLRVVFGFLAMGWRGSARHWKRYRQAYVWMAALATPLVISVHSIVGLDFAVGLIPGWHSTIAPPFFVAGAVLSGFAMVIVISIPLRKFYHLEDLITARHLDMMAKFILVTSLMVSYGYLMELFMGWYSGNTFEEYLVHNHLLGPYAFLYYGMILFNVLIPQVLWIADSAQRAVAVRDRVGGTGGHVAGALCDRCGQPAPRLSAVLLGPVHPDGMGLRHLARLDWSFPDSAVPVHPLSAGHLDLRDARAGGREARSTGGSGLMTARTYGLMAEFESAETLLAATRRAYAAGYRAMDAYSPYPVEDLADALGFHGTRLGWVVLVGGILGGVAAFGLQYYASVILYPVNVGGRPLNSWPSFIPVTFEIVILAAALSAVLGMLWLNGLPEPYHPVFNVERFDQASRDRFFLCIQATDPQFDSGETRLFLEGLDPLEVANVEP